MAARQLPARRYFGVFALIIVVMYALIFFTGDRRTPQLGLDLQGGTTVTLTARTPDGKAPARADLELARQIIEQRVNGLGVAEAQVVTEGDSNIVISVPGDNGERARQLGATAQLRFRPVVQAAAAAGPAATTPSATPTDGSATSTGAAATPSDAATPTSAAGATDAATPTSAAAGATDTTAPDPNRPPVTQEEATAAFATLTCSAKDLAAATDVDRPGDYVASCSTDGAIKYLLGPAVLEGTDVTNAAAGTRSTTGEWIVTLNLNSSGSTAWATFTAANVGKQVAISLDNRVVSAPNINSAINGGQTEISGSFNQTTATELANQLKYGALPLTFSQANAQSVSTQLGSEQLRAGLIAGALGILLVFVYALFYYRLLGLVMIASLVLSAVV
ncbi:MAG: secD, partial [Modestobacter sp.]|nr:secD [Modestobacter sp.]